MSVGPYIVDFCCYEKKLVVELDGGQHAESQGQDKIRSEYLRENGFNVMRFWNDEVLKETEAVREKILTILENNQ